MTEQVSRAQYERLTDNQRRFVDFVHDHSRPAEARIDTRVYRAAAFAVDAASQLVPVRSLHFRSFDWYDSDGSMPVPEEAEFVERSSEIEVVANLGGVDAIATVISFGEQSGFEEYVPNEREVAPIDEETAMSLLDAIESIERDGGLTELRSHG